jgi:hypothetical protein
VELSFGVEAYLAHHRPRQGSLSWRGWKVSPSEEAGWYVLSGAGGAARFRMPRLDDQIAVAGLPDPAAELAGRCVEPRRLPPRVLAGIGAALELLAPPLAGPLHGGCPGCGAPIVAQFDARAYCLQELSHRAHYVYDDVDVLAGSYHWSEGAILAMPYGRRSQYAERARQARQAAS